MDNIKLIGENKIIYDIGNLVVRFQAIERMVCNLIGLFIDADNDDINGEIMTSDINFRYLLDKLYALFVFRFPKEKELEHKLKSLIDEANKIAVKRNKYVHANYYLLRSLVIFDKMTTKGVKGIKRESNEIALDEIENIVNEINILSQKFSDFFQELTYHDYFRNKFPEPFFEEDE
jgi:hypothetical protein